MMYTYIIILLFLLMSGVAHAQKSLDNTVKDQIFWTQQIDGNQEWGQWLKNVYKPYSDQLERAILKIISSTIDIDPAGKSPEELMEEVNAAYTNSLKMMEMIKPPIELKIYHSKVVELYKQTINADPHEADQNALVIQQLSIEADQAITKAFQFHGIPQRVINRFIRD